MNITTREIAELTSAEQMQMQRWTRNVLKRRAEHSRRRTVRAARDDAEGVGRIKP